MKKTLKELRDALLENNRKMSGMLDAADAEQRDLSEEESIEFRSLTETKSSLEQQIRDKEAQEEFRAARSATVGTGSFGNRDTSAADQRDLGSYSFRRALMKSFDKEALDGIEKEMHEEATKEARSFNHELVGIGVPTLITERRDNSVTQPTQPEDGSAVVESTLRSDLSMMDMLRNALVTRQLGVKYLSGLKSDLHWTKMKERPKATWNTEIGNLDKSNAKFEKSKLAPERLGTYVVHSLQFLRQTEAYVEQQIREDLVYAFAEAIDEAVINGSGIGNEPVGILNSTEIASLPDFPAGLGANGGYLDHGKLVALQTILESRNLRPQRLGYLLNAKTRGKLKTTKLDPGSGKFLMESNGTLLEYPAVMSNMVPSNLDKNSAVGVCSGIIFGDWSEVVVAQWGGLDLKADDITMLLSGQVRIVGQTFANIDFRRPEAFVYYKDVLTDLAA